MLISLIVAMGKSGQIGYKSKIPWHLPSDLQNFKKITMGHTLLLGRKTFESIGRPLPGRKTIILSQNQDFQQPSCKVVSKLEEAFKFAEDSGEQELFIAGGAKIYELALPYVKKFYLSRVDYDGEADVFFPPFSFTRGWVCETQMNFAKTEKEPAWTYEVWNRV